MDNGKVKCAVIGAGWWATYAHVPALLAHPRADLAAIQTNSSDQARRIASDFNIARAFTSVEEALAVEGLKAVVVSSAPNLHFEQTAAALRRGLHVLVEKPMTITAAQARVLVDLAAKKSAHLLISCPWHYTAHGIEARKLIRSGLLGNIRMISILMTNPVAHLIRGEATDPTHGLPYMKPQSGTYSDPKIAGGGQIYAQGAHVAAYLSFLTGSKPAKVFARFHNDNSRLDIYDVLNVELEDGCVAAIASTGATPPYRRDFEVRVFGTKAILFLELWQGKMQMMAQEGTVTCYPDLPPEEVYPAQAPATNLIDCALGNALNRSPGELGLSAMTIIESACMSAKSSRDVSVSELKSVVA